ncbi:TonB-dependent receptor [Caulobacter sp. NIBR2454]|uniref:TonB-dependent receptor n=1 Tax=Caulobacter sp. NIBR2454 TaxID=3015996 RepID=UPI0022B65822|nr:TonB-dependent receptor [Caulobacter sp. NIBR2454]
MRNINSSGVRARAKRAMGVAAVAGAAGLSLAPAAFAAEMDAAADAPTEVSGVDIEAAVGSKPQSPKFTAPLVDTPRSITVIPQKVIDQTAATSLQDLLRTSPGITFGAGEGGQPLADRPFIRGQSSGNNIFVDNLRDTGGQIREVFALEQVEVVKGPDSAYNGRGSGGGSINLSTKKPRLETFVTGSARAGTDDYLRGAIDANYQLGATSAIRLNIMGTQGNTPGRPDVVDFERLGFLGALSYGLGTETRVTASYYHLESDDMPDYGVPLMTKVPGYPRTESGVLPVGRDAFYGLTARDFAKTSADIGTFFVEHDFNDRISIRNVFRYSETVNDYIVTNPGDGGAAQFVAGEWWMKRGTKSRWNETKTVANVTEVYGKFTTGGLEHSFATGFEVSREVNDNASYVIYTTAGSACPTGFTNNVTNAGVGDCTRVFAPNPNDPWTGLTPLGAVSTSRTRSGGVYAFDTISFGEKWLLNLGARYDEYGVTGITRSSTSAAGVITGQTASTPPKGNWDFFNYQVGLVYKPVTNASVYVSFGTSSTPPTLAGGDQNAVPGGTGGGSNGQAPTTVLDPEETESIEAGVKWSLFRDQLQLSGAVFQLKRKNAQIQVQAGVYEQAGEAEVTGVELGVSGNVTDKWQVFGGYTFQDSELVRGAYTNVNVGDPLANTPKHSFSMFSTYKVFDKLSLGGGAYYVSKSFGGNQGGAGGGANAIYAPDYWRFDAFAAYQINDRADLQLNVQNVGDKEYIARTNGVHHADYGAGRQAIVTLNVRY